jgi:uncharacterized membrane protein (UPF0127 family)
VTRRTTVAERGRVAGSLRERIFGLHLLPRLQDGEGLLLPGATTIDTTFMGYPIDLVFLDGSSRVTRVVHAMKPWRMVLSGGGGRDCLELPAGAAAASGTEVGDQLKIRDLPENQPASEANLPAQ